MILSVSHHWKFLRKYLDFNHSGVCADWVEVTQVSSLYVNRNGDTTQLLRRQM